MNGISRVSSLFIDGQMCPYCELARVDNIVEFLRACIALLKQPAEKIFTKIHQPGYPRTEGIVGIVAFKDHAILSVSTMAARGTFDVILTPCYESDQFTGELIAISTEKFKSAVHNSNLVPYGKEVHLGFHSALTYMEQQVTEGKGRYHSL